MSLLRSFSGYAKVAPYVPFARPTTLCNFDGYAAGAGWLQFHDKASAPSASAVPLKSVRVAGAGPLSSLFTPLGPIVFNLGLAVAFSSTETTYTADATAFDAWGEVEEWETLPVGYTASTPVNADTGGGISGISSSHPTLYRLIVTNDEGADVWLMLFPSDGSGPSNGRSDYLAKWLIPSGAVSQIISFGAGLRPLTRVDSLGHTCYGYYLMFSTTSAILTSASTGGTVIAWTKLTA